jgi:hypothetical protein
MCSFAVNKESVSAESNRDMPCNAVHPRVEARLRSSLHGNMGIIAYRRAPVQASVWSFVRCVNRRIPAVCGTLDWKLGSAVGVQVRRGPEQRCVLTDTAAKQPSGAYDSGPNTDDEAQ